MATIRIQNIYFKSILDQKSVLFTRGMSSSAPSAASAIVHKYYTRCHSSTSELCNVMKNIQCFQDIKTNFTLLFLRIIVQSAQCWFG